MKEEVIVFSCGNILKMLSAIITSLRYQPIIFIHYCMSFLLGTRERTVNLISSTDLADHLKNGKSLIRIGDGEAMLIMGRSIHYQKFHPEIRSILKKIISEYRTYSPYILAIPVFAITESAADLKTRGRLRIWRLFRSLFKMMFDATQDYADAVIFYHRDNFSKTVTPLLQAKHVVIVSKPENNTPELNQYMNNHSQSWEYISVPAADAYHDYLSICKQIDSIIAAKPGTEKLLVFAAGPASKVLSLHYIERKIQCIDIGHGLEILGHSNDYTNRL